MHIALLDQIRINYGYDQLIKYFISVADRNADEALWLLNRANLMFPSLFVLCSAINTRNMTGFLNERNRAAVNIINDMKDKNDLSSDEFLFENKQQYYHVLNWILKTGFREDGSISDLYDEILDTAAILLTRVYGDRSCLPVMEHLIFNRNRKGAFIYDLVWAFFESADGKTLEMIASRLRTDNKSDIRLARKFLNFIPCIREEPEQNAIKQYSQCIKWLNHNRDQLFYTGETNLQTSEPLRYALSAEDRFLK